MNEDHATTPESGPGENGRRPGARRLLGQLVGWLLISGAGVYLAVNPASLASPWEVAPIVATAALVAGVWLVAASAKAPTS